MTRIWIPTREIAAFLRAGWRLIYATSSSNHIGRSAGAVMERP